MNKTIDSLYKEKVSTPFAPPFIREEVMVKGLVFSSPNIHGWSFKAWRTNISHKKVSKGSAVRLQGRELKQNMQWAKSGEINLQKQLVYKEGKNG